MASDDLDRVRAHAQAIIVEAMTYYGHDDAFDMYNYEQEQVYRIYQDCLRYGELKQAAQIAFYRVVPYSDFLPGNASYLHKHLTDALDECFAGPEWSRGEPVFALTADVRMLFALYHKIITMTPQGMLWPGPGIPKEMFT